MYVHSKRDLEQGKNQLRQQFGVLDLFSGAGGMSLGFKAADFQIVGGIEENPHAAATYAQNFHSENEACRDFFKLPRDITSIDPHEFLNDIHEISVNERSIDVIVGGPPCQAFARVGRAKLSKVADRPNAFKFDPRALLYREFMKFVRELRPLAFVMENVPEIANFGGNNLAEEISCSLDDAGYTCSYTFLNAVHFGVPQFRDRFFLIGVQKNLGITPTFPCPTHRWPLPSGYLMHRRHATRAFNSDEPLGHHHYTNSIDPTDICTIAPTALDALGDLPPITAHLNGFAPKGPRRFSKLAEYLGDTPSGFAEQLRSWPEYGSPIGVYDHVVRHLPRDYAIFARMDQGDQYPQALERAQQMFDETITRLRSQGIEIPDGSDEYHALQKRIVPPYDPSKFPNRWRKMEPEAPARTLTAHLGKDSYTHIHYDSRQARTISVREAARLQSFPDGFKFHGAMNSAFWQIGNAVPPLLAKAIAEHLHKILTEKEAS